MVKMNCGAMPPTLPAGIPDFRSRLFARGTTVTRIYEIADDFVERYATLDPVSATGEGISGHEHELTDYSPEGSAARDALVRETLGALATTAIAGERDRIAAEMMRERLDLSVSQYEHGEQLRSLRVLGSPMQSIRQCFDLMKYDNDDDWAVAAERMTRV